MGTCSAMKQQRRIDGSIQVTPYKICVTAFLWNKDSHNLFDFESSSATKRELELDYSATISIVDNQIVALTDNEYVKKQLPIMRLDCDENHLTVSSISQKSEQRLWVILSSRMEYESLNEWELVKGDLVKLGRMKLQLIDLVFDPPNQEEQLQSLQQVESDIDSCNFEQEVNQCRICFSKKSTNANPLFSPCKCTGSMKYIHLKCLQQWIQQQIKIKEQQNSVQYIWKRMECEVCKVPLKSTYTYQGQIYCIMRIQRPSNPYMIWKITAEDKGKEGVIQVMELIDKSEVKIGRVPDCDIKLKDISVSRSHAIIKVNKTENNTFKLTLTDNTSKFGTLLYAQWDKLLKYDIASQQKIFYQVGRVLLQVQFKEKGKGYNKQYTCYRHPSSVQVQQKVPINEQVTINPNNEKEQVSFQTNNELNSEDIVIFQCQQQKQLQ